MAIINTGQTFTATDTLTNTKLQDIANLATFNDPVDETSLELKGDGKLGVKDGGVTAAKLATDAVVTSKIANNNVTFTKLTDVIDDDTMATASSTTLATSESIKAYVDTSKTSAFTPSTYAGEESVTFPNGLIMKWGIASLSSSGGTITFTDAFPNAVINIQGVAVGADTISNLGVTSFDKTKISCNPSGTADYHWQAIGY